MDRVHYGKPCYIGDYKVPRPCSFEDLPSPATSATSETDSASSATFSGGLCEMENGPEVAPYARSVLSHSSESRRTNNMSSDVTKSSRSSKRQSHASRLSTGQQDSSVMMDRRILRALLLYVRETRLRLQETETKLHNMDKELNAFKERHDRQMITLAKSFLLMQSQIATQRPAMVGSSDDGVKRQVSFGKGARKTSNAGRHKLEANILETDKATESVLRVTENPAIKKLDICEPEVEKLEARKVAVAKSTSADNSLSSATSKASKSNGVAPNTEAYYQIDEVETRPVANLAGQNPKPLYAVIRKNRKDKCNEAAPIKNDVKTQQTPIVTKAPYPLAKQGNTSIADLKSREKATVKSSCNLPDQSVSSAIGDNSVGPKPNGKRVRALQLEKRDKIDSRTKAQPHPSVKSVEASQYRGMASHCTGDGFYITDSFTRSGNYGRNNNLANMHGYQDFEDSSPQSKKTAAALLNRFKKKLKHSKNKGPKGGSKDAISPESTSTAPDLEGRVDVTISTGAVKVVSDKDDGNNNVFQLPDGLSLHQHKSYISYKSSIHDRKTTRPKLDSIGDDESHRSTDASDIVTNDIAHETERRKGEVTGFETVTIRSSESRTPYRSPFKAPSNPNLSARTPPTSPMRRSLSSSAAIYHQGSSSDEISLSSIDEDDDDVIEESVDENWMSSSKTALNNKGYCVCEVTDAGVVTITADEEAIFAELDELNGFILDDVTFQQAEIEKLEQGVAPTERPPKLSGLGFPSPGGGYAIPSGRNMGNPPRTPVHHVMSPEELVQYEAERNLQQKQMNDAEIQRRIETQQREAQENDEWIKAQELKPEVALEGNDSNQDADPATQYASIDPSRKMTKRKPPTPGPDAPEVPKLELQDVKPAPTMKLDREGDNVYRDTMKVVKSVLHANHHVLNAVPDDILAFIKDIGQSLKDLCTSLDEEIPNLPEQFRRSIDMAQKTTNKDLSQIITQTKLVKKFYMTTQVDDYKRCLMAANQVLAMDAKNLLDVVDKARIYKLEQELASASQTIEIPPPPQEEKENSSPSTPTLPSPTETDEQR